MLVVGSYSYRKTIVAYRNDYCLTCDAPRLAHRIRSLEVLHVYFIPLLPLGFFRNWKCSACGADPHVSVRTSKVMKWMGVGVLAVLAFAGLGRIARTGRKRRRPRDPLGLPHRCAHRLCLRSTPHLA